MNFIIRVTIIITVRFKETLFAGFCSTAQQLIQLFDGNFQRHFWGNCSAKRWDGPTGLHFNIYLWILWQTGGSYSIISHFFSCCFTKCSEKKKVTDPIKKNQSDQMTFFFSSFRSPPLFPSPRIGFRMHYVQRKKGSSLSAAPDRRELHTSTATWLWSAVDIQLSRIKRTKTGTRLSGKKFPPCVFVFILAFRCILGFFKGQRSTKKKTRAGYIKRMYRQASSLANLWTAQLNLHFIVVITATW